MPLPEFQKLVDEAKSQIKEISSLELRRMIDEKEEFSLIDVREPDECAKGTIAGTAMIPRGMLEHEIDKVTTDKSRPIVLY